MKLRQPFHAYAHLDARTPVLLNFQPLTSETAEIYRLARQKVESSNVFFGKVPDSQVSQHDWFISKYTPDLRQSMYSVHIEGMIVAFVSLCNIDEFACNAEIGRFLALESIKGKGMFTDILASLLCFCGRKLGIMHTYLLVKNTNCNSIGLYKKLGFTEDAPSISDDYLRMDLRDIKLADFFDNIAISML